MPNALHRFVTGPLRPYTRKTRTARVCQAGCAKPYDHGMKMIFTLWMAIVAVGLIAMVTLVLMGR